MDGDMAELNFKFNMGKTKGSDISKAMYSMIMQMPLPVIYVKHGQNDKIAFANQYMLDFLSCSKEEFELLYKNSFYELLYSGDILDVKTAVENGCASHSDSEIECRIKDKTGNIKWVKAKIGVQNSEEAQGDLLISFFDIGEYKNVQSRMAMEREQYKQILNMNSNIFFEYDVTEDAISFNNSDSDIKLAGQKITNFSSRLEYTKKIYNDDKEKIIALKEASGAKELDFRYVSMDGHIIWCRICAIVVREDEGKALTIVGCINNIDKQKKEEEKLIERAKQDGLTRLYNGIYAKKAVNAHLLAEGRMGKSTMLIIDLDDFSRINDRLGSLFGDAVLINIADNIKKIVDRSDITSRVGGDEFLVYLKNTFDYDKLVRKIEEIREIVKNTYVGDNDDIITCSIGIASYPADGKTFDGLFRNADWALHRAKITGKDTFTFYDSTELDEITVAEAPQFYNNYKIDNRQKKSDGGYDREITAFAFDIMSRTKDVNSAIKLILDRVGKQLDVSYITIYECDFGNNNIMSTYQWNKEGVKKRSKECIALENGVYEAYVSRFKDSQLFVANDTSKLHNTYEFSDVLENNYIKAFMQSAIYEGDKVVGCISASDVFRARKWTKYEKESLATISKVVSSYLLKMRASQKMEEKLSHIKNFDSLTGISTLHRFKKNVKQILLDNPDKEYVLISSDFDKFKYINDTIGYDAGDDLLRMFAEFISKESVMNLCACRMYSDDFLALFEFVDEVTIIDYIEMMSERFAKELKKKYVNVKLTISSGACVVDRNSTDIMSAIDNATTARKYAKEDNGNCCVFFNDKMKEKIRMEFEIISNMEKALAHNEFKVYFQPKVSLETGDMVGAEALVRWVKSDGTIMPPDKFIPLFEKNGFVVNLDFFVYEEVCRFLREWIDKGINVVPISVNVSRIHLYDENFVKNFIEVVDKYNLPYEFLELELTESIFLDDTNMAITVMRLFRELGFKVSIDDFGAGYSSLNLLKEMTSDVLKLDKEFFGRGGLGKEEQIIVSSIVGMAKQLNMKVLSEGVETVDQVKFLKGIACDMAQGYLFAKPMPKENFEVIMANNLKFGMEIT